MACATRFVPATPATGDHLLHRAPSIGPRRMSSPGGKRRGCIRIRTGSVSTSPNGTSFMATKTLVTALCRWAMASFGHAKHGSCFGHRHRPESPICCASFSVDTRKAHGTPTSCANTSNWQQPVCVPNYPEIWATCCMPCNSQPQCRPASSLRSRMVLSGSLNWLAAPSTSSAWPRKTDRAQRKPDAHQDSKQRAGHRCGLRPR